MAEYRTFFLISALIVNIIAPIPFLSKGMRVLGLYAASILLLSGFLAFIKYKKMSYFKKYLSREYVPSTKLALSAVIINTIIMIAFYYHPVASSDVKLSIIQIIAAIVHCGIMLAIFILIITQKSKKRSVISYTRHQYKIGIISHDIGNDKGLKKGQPVEILQDTAEGYIVKDSSNNDYVLVKSDIESVLDIV